MIHGAVYGLYHPHTDDLRYIGQTRVSLKKRLSGHLASARRGGRRHVVCWLKGLLAQGLKPVIRPLAYADNQETLDFLEVGAIAKARAAGVDLTNHADGGGGFFGFKLSGDHKAKLHSPEVRAKMAATRRGQPSPRKGVTLGEETRAKISVSKTGACVALRRPDVPDEAICGLLRKGATSAQVAESLGVTRQTVRRRLLRAEALGEVVPHLARKQVRAEVVRRLLGGQPKEQILVELGISLGAFYQHVSGARRAGAPIPKIKPGPKSPKEIN